MTSRKRTFTHVILAAAAVAAITGCSSTDHRKTQKEEAVKEWNSARAGIMHNLARDQFQTGNFDKARATIDEALKIDAEHVPLLVLSARLGLEQNRLELAEAHLAAARKVNPKHAETLYLSGVLSQRWQKHEDALGYYTAAMEAEPTEIAYLLARAETLVLLDRRPEALTLLQEKVVYFEHSAAIRDAVGQLLMQENRLPEAVEMLRRASILAADDVTIREHLALAQFSAGEYRNCIDTLNRLVDHPDYEKRADLQVALAECRLQLRQPLEARVTFERAAQLNPSLTQAWLGVAKASLSVGDLRRADTAARRAVALAPETADTHLTLGYVRMKQGNLDEAIRSLKTAAAIETGDSVSLCLIGQIYAQRGDHREAMGWYGKALKVNPYDELAQQLMMTAQID